ncbi:hypothetical protein [Pseudoalteromonas maricaloris]|uniref:hypothetical protein n=1 Tax=Pseudoalteromonas maricaloris TaxID=184924 RepID=UPI003C1F5A99
MDYTSGFLSELELQSLRECVRKSYDPVSNMIELDGASPVIEKIIDKISTVFGLETRYLTSYVFLACDTTMERFKVNGGWHTDATCSTIDGTCFNAWLPIYVNSENTGLEIIEKTNNPKFYAKLGDSTEPLAILSKLGAPHLFNASKEDHNYVAVNKYSGTLTTFSERDLQISRVDSPKPGDLCLFEQTDIHRGYHTDGMRIQLSLKFFCNKAKLNSKPTNPEYKLFKNLTGKEDIHSFLAIKKLISTDRKLSKHGTLEAAIVDLLLRN